MKPIITPFRLHSLDYVPSYLPAAAAPRMPAGYFFGLLSSSPCGSTHRCRANKLTACGVPEVCVPCELQR